MTPRIPFVLAAVLSVGCSLSGSDSRNAALGEDDEPGDSGEPGDTGNGNGDFDQDECKIEGSALGAVGAQVNTRRGVVTFTAWEPKAGSNGEFIGFAISLEGQSDVSYVVKAGTELFASTDLIFSHPNGDQGSSAKGISNVDFCEDPPGDEDPPGGGGGEDPYCNDPDGCDGGGGGGGEDPPGGENPPSGGGDLPVCSEISGCGGGGGCETDLDCPTNEFCGESGACAPYVE